MKLKNKVMAALHAGWMSGALVQVKRKRFNETRSGFVIDISAKWLLLNVIDCDFLQNDGYEAVRLKDISEVEIKTDWVSQAREQLGLEPVPQPDVLLIDLPGLLSSVNAHYPLLGIEREETAPGILYLGRIEKLKKEAVTLREIDANGKWESRDIRHPLKEITCITFGNTYMKALLAFARTQEAQAANESDNHDSL